jgi:hypothetical protein
MTTPQALPTSSAEPVYRSRKEAREARLAREADLAAGAWDSTLDVPVSPNVHTETSVSETLVVDDLAGGAPFLTRAERRKLRGCLGGEAQAVEVVAVVEKPQAITTGRVSRFRTFPVAASLSLSIFLIGFPAVEPMLIQQIASFSSVEDKPDLPKSQAPAPTATPTATPASSETTAPVAPVPVETVKPAPVPMTSGNIPVMETVPQMNPDFSVRSQSAGTVSVPRFGESTPRYFLEGASKMAQMTPIQFTLDELTRHSVVRYPSSAPIGAIGVAAISGHRGVGERSPFTRIREMQRGDEIIFENSQGTWVYSLLWLGDDFDPTVPGANKVLVEPVYRTAEKTGAPVERALVITTCGLIESGIHAGDGDGSVRMPAYFEFKSFTLKA